MILFALLAAASPPARPAHLPWASIQRDEPAIRREWIMQLYGHARDGGPLRVALVEWHRGWLSRSVEANARDCPAIAELTPANLDAMLGAPADGPTHAYNAIYYRIQVEGDAHAAGVSAGRFFYADTPVEASLEALAARIEPCLRATRPRRFH